MEKQFERAVVLLTSTGEELNFKNAIKASEYLNISYNTLKTRIKNKHFIQNYAPMHKDEKYPYVSFSISTRKTREKPSPDVLEQKNTQKAKQRDLLLHTYKKRLEADFIRLGFYAKKVIS